LNRDQREWFYLVDYILASKTLQSMSQKEYYPMVKRACAECKLLPDGEVAASYRRQKDILDGLKRDFKDIWMSAPEGVQDELRWKMVGCVCKDMLPCHWVYVSLMHRHSAMKRREAREADALTMELSVRETGDARAKSEEPLTMELGAREPTLISGARPIRGFEDIPPPRSAPLVKQKDVISDSEDDIFSHVDHC
jgi:hypothetical protein